MKLFTLIASTAFLTLSLNVFANEDVAVKLTAEQKSRIVEDLRSVDQFGCNIEKKSYERIRLLTTSFNSNINRFFDLQLDDEGMKLEATATGWKLSQTVDLSKGGHRPFPKWMYGSSVTEIEFTKSESEAKVSVYSVASDLGLGIRFGKTSFECSSSARVQLDKRAACPECLSSEGAR